MLGKGLVSRAAMAAFCGAPLGTVTLTVGNTGVMLKRLPSLTLEAYRALWRDERIGPNLKTMISVAGAPGIALAPVIVVTGSAIGGAGYGFYCGLDDITKTYGRMRKMTREFDEEEIKKLLAQLKQRAPKLREGQEPFDIRIVEAGKGVLAVFFIAPVEAAGLTLTAYRHWIGLYRAYLRLIWNKFGSDEVLEKLLAAASTDLVTVIAVVGLPVVPVLAATYSMADMMYHGYRRGLGDSVRKVGERLSDLNRHLHELRNDTR